MRTDSSRCQYRLRCSDLSYLSYLDAWHPSLQHLQATFDAPIKPRMVTTWTECHKVFLPLDVLLFFIVYRILVHEIIVNTANFSRGRAVA